MEKEQLEQYAHLKQEEKRIAEAIKQLGPLVLEQIKQSGHDKVKSSFGTFSITKRRSYKYSDRVRGIEDGLKTAKAQEEADGTAEVVEKESLAYYQPKENNE